MTWVGCDVVGCDVDGLRGTSTGCGGVQSGSGAPPHPAPLVLPPWPCPQAISMLDDVMHSFSSSPDTAILFSDEMAAVVGRGGLATPLLQELSEKVTTAFQDSFLVDSSDVPPSPSPPSSSSLAPGLALGLDSAEEGCIALNLAPLLAQDSTAASVRAMHAQFRLLRVCEQHLNGCLEGIDALLGEGKPERGACLSGGRLERGACLSGGGGTGLSGGRPELGGQV